jgi:hypothetical protein
MAFPKGNSPTQDELTKALDLAHQALKNIEKKGEGGVYPFLEDPFFPQDIVLLHLAHFHHFRVILIIGPHDALSALKALVALVQSWVWIEGGRPRLCFLEKMDPELFWELLSIIDPITTGVIVMTPEPASSETVLMLMRCLDHWGSVIDPSALSHHFFLISMALKGESIKDPLGSILHHFRLPHRIEPHIVLPLACFSPMTLIPALFTGIQWKKFLEGAALTCSQFFQHRLKLPLEGIALLWVAHHKGFSYPVVHAWETCFSALKGWMKISWNAFSLPVLLGEALPKQRHLFTVLLEKRVLREPLNSTLWSALPQVKALSSTSLGENLQQTQMKFCHDMVQKGHWVRTLSINLLNEETLGALFMNHLLEALLMQEMLDLSKTENT